MAELGPTDRASCVAQCGQAKVGGTRAPLFGCLQDYDGECAHFALCAARCKTYIPGQPCNPATLEPCAPDAEVCDAKTRTCVPIPECQSDSNCKDGYACTPLSGVTACYRNCSDGRGVPVDSLCQPSHACDAQTFECVPWPCVTSGALLDCARGCAALATACQHGAECSQSACDAQSTCMSRCQALKSSSNLQAITSQGCLQLGHECRAFDACEVVCGGRFDGGTRD